MVASLDAGLLAAAVVLLSGPRPQQPSLYDRALGHDSVWIAWAAGAVCSAPGAYYLAGLALRVKLDKPTATDAVAIVGFNLIMFALIELPLLGFLLAPDSAQAITERFSHWMTRHKRTLITVVAGAGGAYLLASGPDRPSLSTVGA